MNSHLSVKSEQCHATDLSQRLFEHTDALNEADIKTATVYAPLVLAPIVLTLVSNSVVAFLNPEAPPIDLLVQNSFVGLGISALTFVAIKIFRRSSRKSQKILSNVRTIEFKAALYEQHGMTIEGNIARVYPVHYSRSRIYRGRMRKGSSTFTGAVFLLSKNRLDVEIYENEKLVQRLMRKISRRKQEPIYNSRIERLLRERAESIQRQKEIS